METEGINNQESPPRDSQNQPLQNSAHKHGGTIPMIIGLPLLLLIVGGGAYYIGTLQNQPVQQQQISAVPTFHSSPTTQPTQAITQDIATIPSDWVYQAFAECSVRFPIPPKKEPYYSSPDPTRQPSVTNDEGSGRFWDFPRGGMYPNLLSKILDEYGSYKQANAWYATAEEASGYIASAVSVSCIPNINNLNNQETLDSLEANLQEYNQGDNTERMEPARYIIQTSQESTRWSQRVYDLTVAEYFANPGGQPITNFVQYTLFATPRFIYEVRVLGATENSFVKETARMIFDNLEFITQ